MNSRRRTAALAVFALAVVPWLVRPAARLDAVGLAAAPKYDWRQFAFNPNKDGNNTLESTITAANVSQLKPLFKVPLNDAPDGAPVLLSDVVTPSGVRDLIYVLGERSKLTAFDANTGETIWSKTFGPGGITNSAPAIDPQRAFIYANTSDGMVHKVRVGDGAEVTTGGWPRAVGGGKSSSQLTIATARNGHTYLYCAKQGKGRIVTIDLDTNTAHVFNLAASEQPDTNAPNTSVSGPNPWARGNPFVPELDRFFAMAATNNGTTWVPGHVWRQSWVALPADGSTRLDANGGWPADSYTPTDWRTTVGSDQDIGSGGLGVLPIGYSAKYPYLGVQPGKDQKIRILNLANLSGQGAPGKLGGELFLYNASGAAGSMRAQVATWTNPADGSAWAFTPGGKGLAGFKVVLDAAGNPSLQLRWKIGANFTTSAIVANNVLFAAEGGGERTTTNPLHELRAIEPTTGAILWRTTIGQWHWTSPIVANGTVYMCDGNSGGFGSGLTGNLMAWRLSDVARAAAPVLSPAGGSYPTGRSVSMTTATVGASIHYTLDGSTPSSIDGLLYTDPIAIDATTTVKAVAFKPGLADSVVTSETYTIGGPTPTPPAETQVYEAETTGHTTTGATSTIQNDANTSGGHWVSLDADGASDLLEFLVRDVPAGTYSVQMKYKTNNNRGILRLTVDGATVGTTLDQYAANASYPTRTFGTVSFDTTTTHLFRLTVTGKNAASSSFVLSADAFLLVPQGGTPPATPTPTPTPTATTAFTPTPTPTPTPVTGFAYVWAEAESGTRTAPMQTGSDAAASGGTYIVVAAGNNSQAAAPATGHAVVPFDVTAAGTYKVWGRVQVATDGDDSFWVRVDSGAWTNWNNIPVGAAWHWDDVHNASGGNAVMTYSLAAGSHTLTIAYREDGTRLDRMLITNDPAFTPTGTGP